MRHSLIPLVYDPVHGLNITPGTQIGIEHDGAEYAVTYLGYLVGYRGDVSVKVERKGVKANVPLSRCFLWHERRMAETPVALKGTA